MPDHTKKDDLNKATVDHDAIGKPAEASVVEGVGGPDQVETAAVRSLEDEQRKTDEISEDEELNEALEESFPASDPISQTSRSTSTQRNPDAHDE